MRRLSYEVWYKHGTIEQQLIAQFEYFHHAERLISTFGNKENFSIIDKNI